MSSETQPIDAERFALALESLPLDALHNKVAEIRNSLMHLKESNTQMIPFADAGDQDCKDAMLENLAVIGRMNQRIELIRVEVVEKRGMPWVADGEAFPPPTSAERVNGTGDAHEEQQQSRRTVPSGRLTDEELRRQLEAQMGEDDDDGGEEEGVHL